MRARAHKSLFQWIVFKVYPDVCEARRQRIAVRNA
jgi:hypothetical protein